MQATLVSGAPAVFRSPGQPAVEFFVSTEPPEIGLRVPYEETKAIPALPYAQISVSRVNSPAGAMLQLTCSSSAVFREFHELLTDLAGRVQRDGTPVLEALTETANNWKYLLDLLALLPAERVIGLWAELFVLGQLANVDATKALSAWTGPLGERHDFRLGSLEIEVKATRAHSRQHIITSLEQLEESPNCHLALLSAQVEDGGAGGLSLRDQIEAVDQTLGSAELRQKFLMLLAAAGFDRERSPLYTSRWQMASEPFLIPIDEDFPRLTPERLSSVAGSERPRFTSVVYTINVEGLGWAWSSQESSDFVGLSAQE